MTNRSLVSLELLFSVVLEDSKLERELFAIYFINVITYKHYQDDSGWKCIVEGSLFFITDGLTNFVISPDSNKNDFAVIPFRDSPITCTPGEGGTANCISLSK